jgi:prephenate dehydratase
MRFAPASCRWPAPAIKKNKASISFHTDHSRGALAKVLTKIAVNDINLSKLQSMPIPSKEWQYSFHADMEFDKMDQFENALKNIKTDTYDLKIFGVYKNGKTAFKKK